MMSQPSRTPRRLALVTLASSACMAAAPPPLEQTQLYTKDAHGCHSVALGTWSHPTRRVLQKSNVVIDKVELCNGDKYPIFTVHFKYDPRTQTSSYFDPLYARMAQANGFWPFSFVDVDDDVVITVNADGKHQLHVAYEDYTSPLSGRSGSGSN